VSVCIIPSFAIVVRVAPQALYAAARQGERCMWTRLSALEIASGIEHTMDECVARLKTRQRDSAQTLSWCVPLPPSPRRVNPHPCASVQSTVDHAQHRSDWYPIPYPFPKPQTLMTTLPKTDTNCTAPSLMPAIIGNMFAASLRTDICPQRKESSSTSHARNPFNLNFFLIRLSV
jgi:hypothetical protein